MTQRPPDDRDGSQPTVFSGLMLASGMAAGALVATLLVISLISALDRSGQNEDREVRDKPSEVALQFPTPSVTSTPGAWPTSALIVFMFCDGEPLDFQTRNIAQSDFYIWLRPESDREVILDVLSGRESHLPDTVRVYKSSCVLDGVAAGTYP